MLYVNSFEVGQHGTRALFPTAFLLAHDCVPNTSHSDDTDDFSLTVRAAHAIKRGQPITLSYAYTLQVRYAHHALLRLHFA
ncbi:SET domain-containing protein SmydA-8, isoform A, partial [Gryllus bimaculatus]